MEKRIYDNELEVGREISSEQQNSIEVSQNAKGERSFKVKVYCDDTEDMKTVLMQYMIIASKMIKGE